LFISNPPDNTLNTCLYYNNTKKKYKEKVYFVDNKTDADSKYEFLRKKADKINLYDV